LSTRALPTSEQAEAFGESLLCPILFAENLLQVKLFEIQKDLLRSIQFNRKTTIKASNSSGKTRCLAIAALWFVACHEEGVCIITSASALQVNKGIFREIHGLLSDSLYPFPEALQTELTFSARRYIIGFSTTASERDGAARLAGMRSVSGHTMCLIDEATGLKNEHFTAIEGILAGGNNTRLVLSGNPTTGSPGMYYYDSFHKNRAQFKCFTISAFDTPNLEGLTVDSLAQLPDHELDNNALPFLVSRRWCRERLDAWTEDSPQWSARVLGEFYEQGDDCLIRLAWLEAAKTTTPDILDGPVCGGLDCAGGGMSETVLVLRRGYKIILIKAWSLANPIPAVIATLRPFMESGVLVSLGVDAIGIGHGYAQMLTDADLPVVRINVGLPASDTERFSNIKASHYWALRDLFEANAITGLEDEQTIAQLSSVRYRLTPRGQVQIIDKDEMKSRLGRSARLDRAEATMLCCAPTGFGGTLYARAFTNDLIFDPTEMGPGFGNIGSYSARYISIAYGAARPMCFLEILDCNKTVWVVREYFFENATALEPKTDAAFAADLDAFQCGEHPLTGEKVLRMGGHDATVILVDTAENFAQEILARGMYRRNADTDLLEGISMVGSVFEKKMLRVSSGCPVFIAQHKQYRWDRQAAAKGEEKPMSAHGETCEAFRLFVKTVINPWRLC
jgi:phage terminase large subunit